MIGAQANGVAGGFKSESLSAASLEGSPVTLPEILARAAGRHPGNGVYYLSSNPEPEVQTYPQLVEEASRVLAGLREQGLKPGQTVIFQLEQNRDFLVAFWACVLGGFVPVPISISPTYEQAHSILSKLHNAWMLLECPPILSGDALVGRLRAYAQREKLEGWNVHSLTDLRRHSPTREWYPSRPDDLALLLLTSGSTGMPKAVRQTHRRLCDWGRSACHACEFDHTDFSINWMPLDHVGGLVMFHLRDVVSGCNQAHAPTELVLQRPLNWLDWISRYRATITWAPNFAYALINDLADEVSKGKWDLSSMRFILNGGEAVVSRTARRFLQILEPHHLPASAMRPAWGMSETCSGVTYSRSFTLGSTSDLDSVVEVGPPIPGVELRIVDAEDVEVPEQVVGRLQIRGISVTDGYHKNPDANRKSFTSDGWFITGDLGKLQQGRLTITGREKDVIIINGVNFYSHEIESLIDGMDGVEVSYTAVCAVRPAGENTDRIAVFFSQREGSAVGLPALVRAIRTEVAKKQGVTPDYIIALSKDEIPKTAIGKIQRSQLREHFERGAFTSQLERSHLDEGKSTLFKTVWVEAPLHESRSLAGSRVLILGRSPLSDCLSTLLVAQQCECSVVDLPEAVAGVEGYRAVLAVENGGKAFTHVVHLGACVPPTGRLDRVSIEQAQDVGGLSVMRLLQALGRSEAVPRVLVMAGQHLHAVKEGDSAVDYRHGPLLGVARTISHEFAQIRSRLVDLDGRSIQADAEALLKELGSSADHSESAYRSGSRSVQRIKLCDEPAVAEAGIVAGGFYLITGALGGVGQHLVRYLALKRCRLLMLGRQPSSLVADVHGSWLAELKQAGAEVHYEGGDLTDPAFLSRALTESSVRWNLPLEGVFHLAGEYHETALADESGEGFMRSIAPKLVVGWALDQALVQHPGARVVYFSSVMSYFSAAGMGAYAAANAALDSLAAHQSLQGRRSVSFAWSLWGGIGMAHGFQAHDAMAVRGFKVLTPEIAFEVFSEAVRQASPLLLIGLDAKNRGLARFIDGAESPASGYVAPRTALEKTLVEYWQDLLSLPKIGVTESFFEIGGRSLLAAKLFARIERELGKNLPLATLYQAPTIEALAQLLENKPLEGATACRLLAIQSAGSRPPFFCIPGGGSDVIVFQDLSKALGSDQPFYGLQARGLDATPIEGEVPTIEEVCAEFVTAIRQLQPKGPYHIGGHCFGSLLAWELARQLQSAGETVASLVLLDPIVSNVFSGEIIGRDRLRYHFAKFMGMSARGKVGYLREKVRNFSRTLVVRQRIGEAYDQARSMHSKYQLGRYDGYVTVFLAEDSFFRVSPQRDPRRYYERLTPFPVLYHEVPGDHHSILHEPGVLKVAALLDRSLSTSPRA